MEFKRPDDTVIGHKVGTVDPLSAGQEVDVMVEPRDVHLIARYFVEHLPEDPTQIVGIQELVKRGLWGYLGTRQPSPTGLGLTIRSGGYRVLDPNKAENG